MRTFTQEEAQKMFETLCFMAIYEAGKPDTFYKEGSRDWHWQDTANRAGIFEAFKRLARKTVDAVKGG